MVTVNFDIQDMFINGQVGEVARFGIMSSTVNKSLSKFHDLLVGKNAISSDQFAQQNCFVPLTK